MLATAAKVVDMVFVLAGSFAHFFVGGPTFVGGFGGSFEGVDGCAVESHLDGRPVYAVEGVLIPFLCVDDIGAEFSVMVLVEKVNCEFACVGGVLDK